MRAVAENKIAPYAAEVDRTASFPQAAYDALVASDFHAPHVPEEYGGVGADAVASAIVVEEVARVCASSALIPGANKLGSTPLILAGSEELKQKYLRAARRGRHHVLLRAVRARGRQRHRLDAHPGHGRRRRLGAQRPEVLDHQRRGLRVLHRPGGDRPRRPAWLERQRLRRGEVRRRVLLRREGEEDRGSRAPPPASSTSTTCASRRPHDRRARRGPEDRVAHPGPHPRHRRRAGGRHRPGRAGLRARLRQGAQAVRQARSRTSRASSSCSRTWR